MSKIQHLFRLISRRPQQEAMPFSGFYSVLNASELLEPHRELVDKIRQFFGVPETVWASTHEQLIRNFARRVQLLPASISHHHTEPGGLLRHSLETVNHAMKIRRGYMLPNGASSECISEQQEIWSFSVLCAALLHDIGNPIKDVMVFLQGEKGSEAQWLLACGDMPAEASYRSEFYRERQDKHHQSIPLLVTGQIIPETALQWLSQYPDVFNLWLLALSGRHAAAGMLGEIITKATQYASAESLAPNQVQIPTGNANTLATGFINKLRQLIDAEQLLLNTHSAAGWRSGDSLYLVAERVLDCFKDAFHQSGQTGVPTDNNQLMDELLECQYIKTNQHGQAVWDVVVQIGDWKQELSCLLFSVKKLWSDSASQPPDAGVIITLKEELNNGNQETGTTHPSSMSETSFQQIDQQSIGRASGLEQLNVGSNNSQIIDAENQRLQSETKSESHSSNQPAVKASINCEQTGKKTSRRAREKQAGQQFLQWLRQQIVDGKIGINTDTAHLHTVDEGLLLVSPAIFRRYLRNIDHLDLQELQRSFQSLNIHRMTDSKKNIWTYRQQGEKRISRLNGMLIPNPLPCLTSNIFLKQIHFWRLKRQRLDSIKDQEYLMTIPTLQQEKSNVVIFSTAIEIWKADRQPVADTSRLVTQLFQRFTRDTGCETFQDVTHQRLLEWKEGVIDHTTRTTWNTYYRNLRAIGNCAVQAGLIESNPFLQVSGVKEYSHLPKVISDEDMIAGIAAIRQQEAHRLPWFWEMVTRFLYYHGIRRKQLVGIRWNDIHYDQQVVNLRAESSKNKIEHCIPLHQNCLDDLMQLQEKTEKIVGSDLSGKQAFNVTLFSVRYFGKEMHRAQVSDYYQRLYEESGIRISAHRLRHTMATKLGTTGNIRVLQEMLGHKSILTTQRYVHVGVGHMRALAISLPELI